jgi:hypothetical protein
MRSLTRTEWNILRTIGTITIDGDVVEWENVRLDAIHHIVHEYANFVSSAEMVTSGQHLAKGFDPPVNTHLFHAFLLNCRKMADFFGNRRSKEDDVLASDYDLHFTASLEKCDNWRNPTNKQLAHISYTRDAAPREITRQADLDMYNELKNAWKEFRRRGRLSNAFAAKFEHEITDKLKSEFRGLDLS